MKRPGGPLNREAARKPAHGEKSPGGPLNRKAARKLARNEKNQRKAQNYAVRKNEAKRAKREEWLQRHPEVVKKFQKPAKARESQKEGAVRPRKRVARAVDHHGADVHEDPLLAFAERAIEAGILGSDGEFDEDKMNGLFAQDGAGSFDGDEDEEISVGSEGEEYLRNDKGTGDDDDDDDADADEEKEEEEDCDFVDVENDSAEEPVPKGETSFPLRNRPTAGAKEESAGRPCMSPVTNTEDKTKLQRVLHGLINRLTMSNFDGIASSIVEQFQNHSRHDVTEILTTAIMNSITRQPNLLDSFIMTFASLTSAMAHLVSIDFVACVLTRCVLTIDQHRLLAGTASGGACDDTISPSRVVMNCVTLLAYLYDLQVIANVTVISLVREAVASMTELDVEVLVKLVRTCGAQLRRDDAGSLKEVISQISVKAAGIPEAEQSLRFKFMLETIQDLKNNRQKLVAVQHGELEGAKKVLRGILLRNNQSKLEPIQVTIAEIRNAKTQGRWWKIGAAWKPDEGAGQANVPLDSPLVAVGSSSNSNSKIHELARRQGMNTDIRRAIFTVLMTSEDYMDAFYRLLALKLSSRQEREIAHVLLHCCAHEKTFNPFYALVASKFLESRHSFVITFKYAFWDRLRSLNEDAPRARKIVHTFRFFGVLLGRRSLPLSILKRASLTQLSETECLAMQVLLVAFLESAKEDLHISRAVSELDDATKGSERQRKREADIDIFGSDDGASTDAKAGDKDEDALQIEQREMAALKTGMRLFFKQYMRGAKELPVLSKPELVQRRIDLVLSVLE